MTYRQLVHSKVVSVAMAALLFSYAQTAKIRRTAKLDWGLHVFCAGYIRSFFQASQFLPYPQSHVASFLGC